MCMYIYIYIYTYIYTWMCVYIYIYIYIYIYTHVRTHMYLSQPTTSEKRPEASWVVPPQALHSVPAPPMYKNRELAEYRGLLFQVRRQSSLTLPTTNNATSHY